MLDSNISLLHIRIKISKDYKISKELAENFIKEVLENIKRD